MSDRELVTIDPKQLTALEMLLGNIASTLSDKLAHVERTLHTGLGAIAQGGGAGDNSQVLLAINSLIGKVDIMSSNIDRIEKEAADLTEDVGLVRTAVDGLSTTITELKTTVADLQAQVAQGQLDQARLDTAAASLEKADDDLDAIVLPSAPAEPPAGG